MKNNSMLPLVSGVTLAAAFTLLLVQYNVVFGMPVPAGAVPLVHVVVSLCLLAGLAAGMYLMMQADGAFDDK